VVTLDTISSSSGRRFVRLSSEIKPMPSFSSNIPCLSSDLFCLSSDCGIVRLEHVPVALVASLETIPSLSSPYLSPVSKSFCSSSPGLYSCSSPSHAKCPSSVSFSVLSTAPSFEPSIAPNYLCFTRPLYTLFTTFCFLNSQLNPFSLILMIIFMTMGLCWFSGSTLFTAIYIYIISPPYCLLSKYVPPLVANPFVQVNEYLVPLTSIS